MSGSRYAILATALLVALLLSACGFLGGDDGDAAGANQEGPPAGIRVANVVMAADVSEEYEPIGTTFTFAPDAGNIWAVVALENVTQPVTVTGAWSYLGPLGAADPSILAEASVDIQPAENPSRRSGLQLIKESFDVGVYQLDVLLNGESIRKVQFSVVQAGADAGATPAAAAPANNLDVAETPTAAVQGTVATPAATQTPQTQPTAAPTAAPAAPGTYVVQSGDSLAAIAAATGSTVQAIAAANNLVNVDAINAGQVLVIPTPAP